MRIAVFIDYQNVYHAARRAFHNPNAAPSSGQISPRKLAELLRLKRNGDDGLVQGDSDQVRVYRGMPRLNDRGYGPALRQIEAWRADGVTVVTRPLSGPPAAPREKGIDISLALDFFEGASIGAFDLGPLFGGQRFRAADRAGSRSVKGVQRRRGDGRMVGSTAAGFAAGRRFGRSVQSLD